MELVFIGRGGGQEHLKEYVNKLNLECDIIFLGGQPKEIIAKRMQEAHFLLQATERETFGVVLAEAMSTGLPCIVSELAVLKELVHQKMECLCQLIPLRIGQRLYRQPLMGNFDLITKKSRKLYNTSLHIKQSERCTFQKL